MPPGVQLHDDLGKRNFSFNVVVESLHLFAGPFVQDAFVGNGAPHPRAKQNARSAALSPELPSRPQDLASTPLTAAFS